MRRAADRAGLGRFHLVGHSLGGAVAQEIALAAPDRLATLTLADTTDWFGDHGPRNAEDDAGSGVPPAVLDATWRALLRWPGSAGRAHAIAVPTLVIHGAADAPKILEGSRRLVDAIEGARHVVIDDAAHSPHEEQPKRFNRALADFFAAAGR